MATMIKINSKKLHEALDEYNAEHGTTFADLSRQMGRADSYLHTTMNRGTMHTASMRMVSVMFGVKPETYVATVDEESEETAPDWNVSWTVEPEKRRVCCAITGGGRTISAYARVKDPENWVTIVQAISYAAHMCYKKAEQEALEEL